MKVQSQIDELLTLRASEWVEILKNPTEQDRQAFIAWLSESRRHVQEFMEVSAVDDAVGGMPAELREDLDALLARVTPQVAELPSRVKPLWGRTQRRPPKLAGLAAACAVMAIGAVLFARTFLSSEQYSTDIGELRVIELADRSVVTLNADSRIQWHVDSQQREIQLRRGEAIFTVARDESRPFRVHTPAGVIQALGTQFNVYARQDGTTRVSVLEGRVQLTAKETGDAGQPQTTVLKAGEEADIQPTGAIQRNAQASVNKTVAWRERRLAFTDAPLEEMIAEFNRYNRSIRLRLEDVPPGVYRFAGIFNADDPESLAQLLSRESDLEVERREREIVIRRAGDR